MLPKVRHQIIDLIMSFESNIYARQILTNLSDPALIRRRNEAQESEWRWLRDDCIRLNSEFRQPFQGAVVRSACAGQPLEIVRSYRDELRKQLDADMHTSVGDAGEAASGYTPKADRQAISERSEANDFCRKAKV